MTQQINNKMCTVIKDEGGGGTDMSHLQDSCSLNTTLQLAIKHIDKINIYRKSDFCNLDITLRYAYAHIMQCSNWSVG